MTNRFQLLPLRASRLDITRMRCYSSSQRLPALMNQCHVFKHSVNIIKCQRFDLRVRISKSTFAAPSHTFCISNRKLHNKTESTSNNEERAREVLKVIADLDGPARKILIEKLSQLPNSSDVKQTKKTAEVEESEPRKEDEVIPLPTLMVLGLMSAIPFIGFGFLDNALMLVAGDLIDHSVSIYLHTSVMASAAMGNVVSGAIGMQLHGIIDRVTQKIFLMKNSKETDECNAENGNNAATSANHSLYDLSILSPAQLNSRPAFLAGHIGGTIGIILGLCLGMTPLLFLSSNKSSGSRDDSKSD
ncbi:hypothetical protein XU18_4863 [Perkinsela sp. CCAP 1560/4]|nr:hypothetical protein XU18_4863 [Perkinsela sp. CCAP 1560/4]|eukprot:KNH03787.1 hypothetical protein XU18_4863 [Perkinsela sp. CCAP 1560/4]